MTSFDDQEPTQPMKIWNVNTNTNNTNREYRYSNENNLKVYEYFI